MKPIITATVSVAALMTLAACNEETSQSKESIAVDRQQAQYAAGQPIPAFDWSLERDLVIQLYELRNQKIATHSVWRSLSGAILYDCPSFGYGIPYDTSLTNPIAATRVSEGGFSHSYQGGSITSIEQAEPNGIFASKNTAATWVMCTGEDGGLEPVYIEATVNVYPFPLTVDYDSGRIARAGAASVTLRDRSDR